MRAIAGPHSRAKALLPDYDRNAGIGEHFQIGDTKAVVFTAPAPHTFGDAGRDITPVPLLTSDMPAADWTSLEGS